MAPVQEHSRPTKCASCDRPLEIPLLCSNCHTLLPADDLNYFEMFGLEPAYDLEPGSLRTRFFELARSLHPDSHPNAAESVRRLSLQNSARLNQAFAVLGDPLQRAEYLLELRGGRTAIEDKRVPQEVLTESLMLREEIEEIAGNESALAPIREKVRAERDRRAVQVASLARRLPGDEALRDQLRLELNAIKYYRRMLEQV